MCGIAGIVDLRGKRDPDRDAVARMNDCQLHRGPDEEGFLSAPGVYVGQRRLSIIGLADGKQPIYNEDGTVAVMYNGELFDYVEQRAALERQGHVFRTHADTEILVHLYEQYGEDMFRHLRGQFAFALFDLKKRLVLLARDRVGICPLHWARQGDWFVFGSEIKAILKSGLVPAACDVRGLDHMFTFFAMATRRTMFEGISSIVPGHYLRIQFRPDGEPAEIEDREYWDLDFPDDGEEYDPPDPRTLLDEYDAVFRRAVELRLRADVPVVGYLSGGIDSGMVMAVASKVRGEPVPSFTIRIPKLDETDKALVAARHIGCRATVVNVDDDAIAYAYPKLVAAADCPVTDTSAAALWCLSREVHAQGYKVALSGEGSDEALAGYVWFKTHKMMRWFDFAGMRPSYVTSRVFRKLAAPHVSWSRQRHLDRFTAGPTAQSEMYNFVSLSRHRFYSDDLKHRLGEFTAYEDLQFDVEKMRRWHPLNRSLYLGYKSMLAGMLLTHKGDRVNMANSVETRPPFLDEEVIKLCCRVHPRWKLRGPRNDKYLLRQTATRYLPRDVALRPKKMFRAPLADSFFAKAPPFVEQLMSEESLRKTGYFDVAEVRRRYEAYRRGQASRHRFFVEFGLITALSTQLWHHIYLGGDLCELPQHPPSPKVERLN